MAKKQNNQEQIQPAGGPIPPMGAMPAGVPLPPGPVPTAGMGSDKLPKEAQEKLKKIKKQLDKFKKEILKKFEDYVMGISLLPPPQPKEGEKLDKDIISVLVLIDDSDSKKMPKWELQDKLFAIIDEIAKKVDEKLKPETILLSELWQSCYDAKYEILSLIALGAPIHDTGMLQAIKLAELHKQMVLKKFEKYIVSYVLAGSLVQGKATKESDVDVFVVIDDTDVKKMTRAELKDKLRAIIIGMGLDVGDRTGIRNKLNIQVYILTDFWDSVKEANPIIFTFLRDGIPFYDRGTFMPWKQLLKMGRIKPSMEAIEKYMASGEQVLKTVRLRIKEIGMEDIFWALITPSQAALMLYGVPPPTPKETPELMRDLFVKKEGFLEEEYVKIIQKAIDVRKNLEHGTMKDVTGKEIDKLLADAEKYLKRIDRLFKQIEKVKEEETIVHIYDRIATIVRDVLKIEGIEKVQNSELIKIFEDELISSGKIPAKYLRDLNELVKAKNDYDAGKLTKSEVEKVKISSSGLIKFLVEYMQRKRGMELERTKIRVKHGSKYGEVTLLGDTAYIKHDIDAEELKLSKAKIKADGSLGPISDCTLEEFEQDVAKIRVPPKAFIKQPIFEDLERVFGRDVEILISF